MARKKSVKRAARHFCEETGKIVAFLNDVSPGQSEAHVSWLYEYAVIRLFRELESLILQALVGAINNDSSTLSSSIGIKFPEHLSQDVCEFIVIGNGYFGFASRELLIKKLKEYVPNNHYLVKAIKTPKYKSTIELLCPLRNLAAHDSGFARTRAKQAVSQSRMSSAGAWLKSQGRFRRLVRDLVELARQIESSAPY